MLHRGKGIVGVVDILYALRAKSELILLPRSGLGLVEKTRVFNYLFPVGDKEGDLFEFCFSDLLPTFDFVFSIN